MTTARTSVPHFFRYSFPSRSVTSHINDCVFVLKSSFFMISHANTTFYGPFITYPFPPSEMQILFLVGEFSDFLSFFSFKDLYSPHLSSSLLLISSSSELVRSSLCWCTFFPYWHPYGILERLKCT